MESRIVSIENGSVHAQIPLDIASLRNQLLAFRNEFEKSLSANYQPDIDWEESEKAMRNIAFKSGTMTLPTVSQEFTFFAATDKTFGVTSGALVVNHFA